MRLADFEAIGGVRVDQYVIALMDVTDGTDTGSMISAAGDKTVIFDFGE